MLKHHLTKLPSGLTVLRIPMPAVESVTVLTLVNTGSRYESPQEQGIAHFLEHMVFKGTAQYPDAQAVAAAVDAVGGDFNAFTSKEYTGYYIKAAARHLDLALDVISDMLLTPRLNSDDIEREKQVIIEEMNMYADTPARHIGDVFENMMFKGSGLEHDVIGSKSTVSSIKRPDFDRFLAQWYGLHNVIVVLAGAADVLNSPATLKKATQFFDKKATQPRTQDAVSLKSYLKSDPISHQQLLVEHKATEQAHFILAFPGFDRNDPRRYALAVLATILGGNMSSRLFTEIREKRGLCYYVHSDTDLYHDTGVFGGSAGVDPNRITEAVSAMVDEFTAVLGGKPITAAELTKAQEYIAGKTILSLEDTDSVAHYFGMKLLLTGKIESPQEVLNRIRSVTLADLAAVAHDLIKPSAIRFAVIGPYQDKSLFEKVLAQG